VFIVSGQCANLFVWSSKLLSGIRLNFVLWREEANNKLYQLPGRNKITYGTRNYYVTYNVCLNFYLKMYFHMLKLRWNKRKNTQCNKLCKNRFATTVNRDQSGMKNNSVLRKACQAICYWGPLQNCKQRAMKWSEIWHHKTLLVLCELINHKHCPSLAMCVVYVCIM